MNHSRRFLDPSQPQTLQFGTMLLYINAGLLVLNLIFRHPIGLALIVGLAAGGYGIANEKRWGYQLGVAAAVVNLALPFIAFGLGAVLENLGVLLSLLFDFALVALLLHPQSREYQKIWFK